MATIPRGCYVKFEGDESAASTPDHLKFVFVDGTSLGPAPAA